MDTPHQVSEHTHGAGTLSRRQLLQTTMGATLGLSGILLYRQPPVFAATREITMLSWNHYVPRSDVVLREQAATFSKDAGVKVTIDTIPHAHIAAKLVGEAQAGVGHDVILLRNVQTALHKDTLMVMDDLAAELAGKYGQWYDVGRLAEFLDGHWRAIPWFYVSAGITYRTDLFQQVGEPPSDSYDDLLRAGRKLKKIGHPIGFAISQSGDSTRTLYPILWSFGARYVEEDGKTVAINSPATAAAVEYVKELYNDCMTPEVLSWDDASNNRFMLSGKGSWTRNAISIYVSAKEKNMPVADKFDHTIPPRGPERRLGVLAYHSLGVWKFSKNQDVAKEWIRFLFQPGNFNPWIEATGGFSQPLLPAFDENPIWRSDPKLKALIGFGKYATIDCWPGPATAAAAQTFNTHIIANMFAKAVTGTSTKEAIAWAESELRRIYEKSV
jgi:multiple sugar transport system substrate-binding protein